VVQSASAVRCAVVATYRATRIDINSLKHRLAEAWSQRLYLEKLDRDWAIFSFTSDADKLPSLSSTASKSNGGFDRADMHVGVARRGAFVVYNADARGPLHELEQAMMHEPKIVTPLQGTEVKAREGASWRAHSPVALSPSLCLRL
jgi:hypothetical protein